MQNTQIAPPKIPTSTLNAKECPRAVTPTPEPSSPADVGDMTVDQMRVELSSIVMALIGLPRQDFIARVELRERQQDLRHEVSQRLGTAADTASLRRELAGLERRVDQVLADRPNIVAMNAGSGTIASQKLVSQYDEASELDDTRNRINELERRILAADAS